MLKYAETPEGKSVAHAVRMFVDNQYRDDDDRARFLSLYSFPPSLDYRYKVRLRHLYDAFGMEIRVDYVLYVCSIGPANDAAYVTSRLLSSSFLLTFAFRSLFLALPCLLPRSPPFPCCVSRRAATV